MPRPRYKLSATFIKTVKVPGMYGDGGGLWLQVTRPEWKSWVFRYTKNGKAREMGLGSVADVKLATARKEADQWREQLAKGIDPLQERARKEAEDRVQEAKSISFSTAAETYIESHRSGWRNSKHAAQWTNTVQTYAYKKLGELPVSAIDTGLVLSVLEPIWKKKPETASRVRGRIESILNWATSRGYRSGENPARWRGHLDNLLPARAKVAAVSHHAALPYASLPEFMKALRAQAGIAARALEFTILTGARTGESVNARWDEFARDRPMWIVPAERMKAHREHRVPLSEDAVRLLSRLAEERQSDYVFPGARANRPLSNMAMLNLLQRMGHSNITVHGFRSALSDWAHETTSYPNEVIEMALAHVIRNKVEAAYRRGDLADKRASLMEDWARYLRKPKESAEVIPIKRRVRKVRR